MILTFKLGQEVHSIDSHLEILKAAGEGLGIHRLAAKAQILELVDKHSSLEEEPKPGPAESEDMGEKERIKLQIVSISTNTNVISPFTSFIGIDPDQQGMTKNRSSTFGFKIISIK